MLGKSVLHYRITDRIASAKVRNVIATSGTAAALSEVAIHLRRGSGKQRPVVSRTEMSRISKRLSRIPVAERRKIEGIGPRRAEIIVAGATVYNELLERLDLKGFRYSPLGLRDGILAQMAADYDRSTRSGRQIESEHDGHALLDAGVKEGIILHAEHRDFGEEFQIIRPQ